MGLEVTGKIKKFLDKQTGTSKEGKEWIKQQFVLDNNEKFNNIFCFEVFGKEKVDNLNKFNKVGDTVRVEFNISTNEFKDKFYTSLSAWKIMKVDLSEQIAEGLEADANAFPPLDVPLNKSDDTDDLPF